MFRNRQPPIRHEITSQEQQEGSNQVIKDMQEFSAEEVSGLDNHYNDVIINQLSNYNTSRLNDDEKNEFIKILQGVLNSDDKDISEAYKSAVIEKLKTLNKRGGARKRRKSLSRSKSKRTKSRSRNKSKSRK